MIDRIMFHRSSWTLTIYPDVFFPAPKARMKKLIKFLDRNQFEYEIQEVHDWLTDEIKESDFLLKIDDLEHDGILYHTRQRCEKLIMNRKMLEDKFNDL